MFRLLLGSVIIFVALNSGPARVNLFDSLWNFTSFIFFLALFFLGLYIIVFSPESKINKRLEIVKRLHHLRKYAGSFLVLYGIFMPGLHHVNRIFENSLSIYKYPVATLIFFFGLCLLGFYSNGSNDREEEKATGGHIYRSQKLNSIDATISGSKLSK